MSPLRSYSYGVGVKAAILAAFAFCPAAAFAQFGQGFNLNGISHGNIAPVPQDSTRVASKPKPSKVETAKSDTGEWTTWLQGRDDYGYLPGTENLDSGSDGFKVYYRCSKFYQLKGAGNQVSMYMQFRNDKGGDIGIATWRKGLSEEDPISVKFEGTASYSRKKPYNSSNDSLLDSPNPVLTALNEITDYEDLCTHAYKTIEPHRQIILKYRLRKDIKSMQRLYGWAKFVPGPFGVFSDGMDIALAVGSNENRSAGIGVFCMVSGLVLEKVSHGIVRSEVLRYVIGNSCETIVTVGEALAPRESTGYPLFFTGAIKETKNSDVHFLKKGEERDKTRVYEWG